MIRPLTCLSLIAALGSGLYLYSEKHRAELLDRKIGAIVENTEKARARTEALKTEWAMLNQPERLEEMAGKYLQTLKPMSPGQFVQLANLATQLPAPEAPKPEGAPDDDAPVPVAGDPAAAPPTDPVTPDPTPAPVRVAEQADPKPVAHPAPKLLAKADSKPHHVTLADHEAMPQNTAFSRGAMLPLAAPQPMGARVMSAMARPQPRARMAVVSAAPTYAPPAYIGSAIATGRSALPPPVPLGANEQ